jgi:hypothetical protein
MMKTKNVVGEDKECHVDKEEDLAVTGLLLFKKYWLRRDVKRPGRKLGKKCFSEENLEKENN